MLSIFKSWKWVTKELNCMGNYFPQLLLRLFLAYEFLESGLMKFNGTNWFSEIQSDFPFPFSIIPPEISWQIATWFELIGPVALILGLGTRFFSASLIILTIVAWVAVHAGNGYNFSNNGYKLALIYLIMFTPLLFKGAGKLSIDHLLSKRFASNA